MGKIGKIIFACCFVLIYSCGEQVLYAQTKVACIGNSVSYGYGIENREENCYPAQLQELLGEEFEVVNFGLNGATLLKNGHRPYIQNRIFQEALDCNPDWIIIHLGLNDTDPRNWPRFRKEFTKDYSALIDTFRNLPSKPKIWICKMTPIFHGHPRFKSGTRDWFWQIQEKIEVVATGKNTGVIDLHTPLYVRPDLFPDNLHPDQKGAAIIAQTVYAEITGDFGGLQIPDVFNTHMLFQRKVELPVYGQADRGAEVQVQINGVSKTVVCDEHGKWKVLFPPMEAGGPYTLKISDGTKQILIEDVLIGDVYLCSGQSNMAFELKDSESAKKEIAKANYPNIRLYNMKANALGGKRVWTDEELNEINELEFFSGEWKPCNSESIIDFSAIAYHFGKRIHKETGVPIGLIHNAKGGSPTEAWIDRKTLEFHPQLVNVLSNWESSDFVHEFCKERAAYNIQNAKNELQRHPFHPAYLYEAGIDPLKDFPIKGVIWYQGESNAHNVEFHEQLFHALIQSWTKTWNEAVPFYFVQLSSINRYGWDHFRDSQRRLANRIPNCEMVVSSDLGHPDDVHPKKKKEIGERLARVALKKLYHKELQWQGPVVKQYSFRENKVLVEYSFAKLLKTADGNDFRGFEIAGEDEIFYPANIKILGNKIELWTEKVPKPNFFRYGYTPYSDANLVNESGLPSSTYTTEFEQQNKR